MAEAPLRVCPFCHEAFEARERCPAHDLALVPVHRLPVASNAGDDAPVGLFELRRGRGVALLGAGLVLAGFLLPMFVDARGALPPRSGLSVANDVAPVLFLVPAAAALVASIALRRGTRRALRPMRVVVPALALVLAAAEAHVVRRVLAAGATELAHGLPADVAVGYGAFVVLGGALLVLVGGVGLGGGDR